MKLLLLPFWVPALRLRTAKAACVRSQPTTLSTQTTSSVSGSHNISTRHWSDQAINQISSISISTSTIASSALSASTTLVASTTSVSTTASTSTTSTSSTPPNVIVNGGFDSGVLSPWTVSGTGDATLFSPGYNNTEYFLQYDFIDAGNVTLNQAGVYTIPGTEYQFYFAASYGPGSNTPVTCSATTSASSSVILGTATGSTNSYTWTLYSGSEYFTGVGYINITCTFTLGDFQGMSIDKITLAAVN